jgi:Flp pilus assembly protein TadG
MTAANHESRSAVTSGIGVDERARGSFRALKHGKALRLQTNAQRSAAEGLPSVRRLRRLGRKLRGESGQSVVEFGMVVPLLCTLVLVFVDFGKSMNYWIDLTHVANQIARQAAVNSPVLTTLGEECAQLETNELRTGSSSVDPAVISVTYPSGATAGNVVTVEVASKYKFIPFMGTSWTIKGTASMRLEHDATAVPGSGTCS